MTVLSEERQLIKATAAQFADDVVLPAANRLDPVKGMVSKRRSSMVAVGWVVLSIVWWLKSYHAAG